LAVISAGSLQGSACPHRCLSPLSPLHPPSRIELLNSLTKAGSLCLSDSAPALAPSPSLCTSSKGKGASGPVAERVPLAVPIRLGSPPARPGPTDPALAIRPGPHRAGAAQDGRVEEQPGPSVATAVGRRRRRWQRRRLSAAEEAAVAAAVAAAEAAAAGAAASAVDRARRRRRRFTATGGFGTGRAVPSGEEAAAAVRTPQARALGNARLPTPPGGGAEPARHVRKRGRVCGLLGWLQRGAGRGEWRHPNALLGTIPSLRYDFYDCVVLNP
jgi:hypothetical protein